MARKDSTMKGKIEGKGKRYSAGQIVKKLREAEALLASGRSIGQVCQSLGVSGSTYFRWKKQYGGMSPHELKRLKELEAENARLKRIVADQALDITMLKEVAEGNW